MITDVLRAVPLASEPRRCLQARQPLRNRLTKLGPLGVGTPGQPSPMAGLRMARSVSTDRANLRQT